MKLTDYIESDLLLYASEPETEGKAREMLSVLTNDEIGDIQRMAQKLLHMCRAELGKRNWKARGK